MYGLNYKKKCMVALLANLNYYHKINQRCLIRDQLKIYAILFNKKWNIMESIHDKVTLLIYTL